MILKHAYVYCKIVFISFVTDDIAAKLASVRMNTHVRCGISN